MKQIELFDTTKLQIFRICLSTICIFFLGCPTAPQDETPKTSDFSLEDLNPSSPTYGQFVGPTFYKDRDFVVAFYFGDHG